MTNGEKIRKMTDEELAEAMKVCPPHREWCDCSWAGTCQECRLDWIRKEEEEAK